MNKSGIPVAVKISTAAVEKDYGFASGNENEYNRRLNGVEIGLWNC